MANWLSNTLSGVLGGAGAGSSFGPWGAAAGGALGGLAGLFGVGKGKSDRVKNYSPYTKEQQNFIGNQLNSLGPVNNDAINYIQQLLSEDPNALSDFEQPYLDRYNEETVPGIAERFAGLGAQSSSGFNQAMAQGARGLQTDLAALRAGLKSQALNQLNNMTRTGLTQINQPYVKKGTPGLLDSMAPQGITNLLEMLNEWQQSKGNNAFSGMGNIRNQPNFNFWG
jgi:hypothetical protein